MVTDVDSATSTKLRRWESVVPERDVSDRPVLSIPKSSFPGEEAKPIRAEVGGKERIPAPNRRGSSWAV